MKLSMAQIAKQRQEFKKTIPIRAAKGLAGLILFLPMTMVSFAIVCFQRNIWPWDRNI